MHCLQLIKFDVSNTSYYVEVENGELLHEVAQSWKMILGGHGIFFFLGGGSVGTWRLHAPLVPFFSHVDFYHSYQFSVYI